MAAKNKNHGRQIRREELVECAKKIYKELGPMTISEFRVNKSKYRICNMRKFYFQLMINSMDWPLLAKEAGFEFNAVNKNRLHRSEEGWMRCARWIDSE